jgi:hypothetical protein
MPASSDIHARSMARGDGNDLQDNSLFKRVKVSVQGISASSSYCCLKIGEASDIFAYSWITPFLLFFFLF